MTSAILALLLAASMTACGEKTADTSQETSVTTAAETEKTTEATMDNVSEETVLEETDAETVTEETAEEEPETEKSEKDALIEDIIAEYEKNSSNEEQQYYYDGNTLILCENRNTKHKTITYNIDTKETKELDILGNYSAYFNGKLYTCANSVLYVYDTQGQLLAQLGGKDFYIHDFYPITKEGGIFSLCTKRINGDLYDGYYKISPDDLNDITELPELEFDIGHGEVESFKPTFVPKCIGKIVIAEYLNREDGTKLIDLSTMGVKEPNEKFDVSFARNNSLRQLTGKYFVLNGTGIYNMETGEIYDGIMYDESAEYRREYDSYFITDKAFYFVADYKLWKYISQTESELIYDGSSSACQYEAVSDEYFVVSDKIGTFLVDMATGEEHKIELK